MTLDAYQRELDKRRSDSNAVLLRALYADDAHERCYAFVALVDSVPHSGAIADRRSWTAAELQEARRACCPQCLIRRVAQALGRRHSTPLDTLTTYRLPPQESRASWLNLL